MFMRESAFNLINGILTMVNNRLADHCLRVAYIYLKMHQYEGKNSPEKIRRLMFCAMFHDIGAFKTEEISDLLTFDAQNTLSHSVYGYLFIKYLSYMEDYAEVILYHHLTYNEREDIDSEHVPMALRLHLADRIDVYLANKLTKDQILAKIKSLAGSTFDPADVELFMNAEEKYQIIDALNNSRYKTEITGYYNMLGLNEADLMKLIKLLVFTIDFKSEQTVTHTIQTEDLACQIALRFGIEGEELRKIRCAALLHDVGKIMIPSHILEKAGRLTPEERVVMETHVVYTERLIKGAVNDDVLKIAVRHHEKLDGSGYPRGIKADQLSLEERIMAVADILSALVSKRSYKEILPKEQAIEIISGMASKGLLDNEVVSAMVNNYDPIMDVCKENTQDVIRRYESLKSEYIECVHRYRRLDSNFPSTNALFSENLYS